MIPACACFIEAEDIINPESIICRFSVCPIICNPNIYQRRQTEVTQYICFVPLPRAVESGLHETRRFHLTADRILKTLKYCANMLNHAMRQSGKEITLVFRKIIALRYGSYQLWGDFVSYLTRTAQVLAILP